MLWSSLGVTIVAFSRGWLSAWAALAVSAAAFLATLRWGDRRPGFHTRRYRDMVAASGWPYRPTLAVLAVCFATYIGGFLFALAT